MRPLVELPIFSRRGFTVASNRLYDHMMTTKILDYYYNLMRDKVRRDITNMLYEGYGTLMFESSEDGAPVINVLVLTMDDTRTSVRTCFLTSVCIIVEKTTAEYYTKMARKIIDDWLDPVRIFGIVTDNTSNVRNARNEIMFTTGRMISSQDQAHICDILIGNIGEIDWVREPLKMISKVAVFFRRYRKRKEFLSIKNEQYNATKRSTEAHTTMRVLSVAAEPESDISLINLGDEGYGVLQHVVDNYEVGYPDDIEVDDRDTASVEDSAFILDIAGGHKHMKKFSNVRFASCEANSSLGLSYRYCEIF